MSIFDTPLIQISHRQIRVRGSTHFNRVVASIVKIVISTKNKETNMWVVARVANMGSRITKSNI
jgi:hypothetical protein